LSEHDYTGNIRELRSLLLRALLFRTGSTISVRDLEKAAGEETRPRQAAGTAEHSLAERTLNRIEAEEGDFWSLIHQPFSEKQMTRDAVRQIIETVRRRGAHSMPEVARRLRACDPGSTDEKEQRRFYKFKNFLYKTVKI